MKRKLSFRMLARIFVPYPCDQYLTKLKIKKILIHLQCDWWNCLIFQYNPSCRWWMERTRKIRACWLSGRSSRYFSSAATLGQGCVMSDCCQGVSLSSEALLYYKVLSLRPSVQKANLSSYTNLFVSNMNSELQNKWNYFILH